MQNKINSAAEKYGIIAKRISHAIDRRSRNFDNANAFDGWEDA